jgi:L-fucose isomerase-like protein
MLKIGYLPLAARGGETIGDVFGWKNSENLIHDTVKTIVDLGADAVHTGDFVSDPAGFAKSKEIFRNAKIDLLFVQNITIGGVEGLFNIIKDTDIPVILSAVPEPDSLYESGPPTKYLASYCGANWNSNMCYLAGKKTKFIYGRPDDPDFKESLGISLKVISAMKKLQDWKICVVGSKTPGYYGAIFSEDLLMMNISKKGSAKTSLVMVLQTRW